MAFNTRPTAQLTYGVVDGTGSKGTMQFDIPYGTLAAAALAAADVLRPLIQTVTGCVITSQSISYSSVDNNPGLPTVDSRIERKGVLQFLTAAGKTVTYSIPGILSANVKQSGGIDEDEVSMALLINGIKDVGVIFVDSNGVDITAYKGGYERYRASTKGMLPRERKPDPDILPE